MADCKKSSYFSIVSDQKILFKKNPTKPAPLAKFFQPAQAQNRISTWGNIIEVCLSVVQ